MNQNSKIALMREKLFKAYADRAEILKALAHPTRLIMIETMQDEGEICVGDLVEMVGGDQSTTSKHLAVLKAAGLVEHKKQGQRMLYRLVLPRVAELLDCVEEIIEEKLESARQ
jgi:ArsR family transcriptional regulator